MKKLILSFSVIIAFTFYALLSGARPQNSGSMSNVVSTAQLYPSASNAATAKMTTVAKPSSTPNASVKPKVATKVAAKAATPASASRLSANTPTPAPVQTAGKFKDGTYTGTVADAYYGNVQVSATIQNGALADVQFLQYPNDRSTSERINAQAMPVLKSEAIQAQSANVDIVSGATQTSQAFQKSLASALTQAS